VQRIEDEGKVGTLGPGDPRGTRALRRAARAPERAFEEGEVPLDLFSEQVLTWISTEYYGREYAS